MTIKKKKKVELPPKFETIQLVALQLGIGLVVLYFILKTDEIVKLFDSIPLEYVNGKNVLLVVKIIDVLCAFCCLVLSGGKSIEFYNNLQAFIKTQKQKEDE